MTFTDKPWPTKEELEKKQAEEKKNAPRKSLFKALKNAAEDMFKMPQSNRKSKRIMMKHECRMTE